MVAEYRRSSRCSRLRHKLEKGDAGDPSNISTVLIATKEKLLLYASARDAKHAVPDLSSSRLTLMAACSTWKQDQTVAQQLTPFYSWHNNPRTGYAKKTGGK